MIASLHVMQMGFLHYHVIITHYYVIITQTSVITHYYPFQSPELADDESNDSDSPSGHISAQDQSDEALSLLYRLQSGWQ